MYTIYSADWCGYCTKAKELLEELGEDFLVVDVDRFTQDELKEMMGFLPKTIPQIFFEDTLHIGGYTELVKFLD